MTPEQEELILRLRPPIDFPPLASTNRPPITGEEFLRLYPANNGAELASQLFNQARAQQDSKAFSLALVVARRFDALTVPLATELIQEDFHTEHEELVWWLQETRSPDAVPALIHAANHVPPNIAWDDNRVLAVKAIWALRKNPSPSAVAPLIELTHSNEPVIATNARDRLLGRIEDEWLPRWQPPQTSTTHRPTPPPRQHHHQRHPHRNHQQQPRLRPASTHP